MQPSHRILHQAESALQTPIADVDVPGLRAGFAALMDQCANAVTLEHGLDMDDVLLERYALIGADSVETGACQAVTLPFLVDQAGIASAVESQFKTEAGVSGDLQVQAIGVRVLLETGSPLFNQAGNQPGRM